VWFVAGTCFLDAKKNFYGFSSTKNSFKEFLSDPKLKPVSYDPLPKNGVLIYGHNKVKIRSIIN